MQENACEFSGDWLWLKKSTSYTAELTLVEGTAQLSVAGVGQALGKPGDEEMVYSTLWVGNTGNGDWPECRGSIETVMIEPLH